MSKTISIETERNYRTGFRPLYELGNLAKAADVLSQYPSVKSCLSREETKDMVHYFRDAYELEHRKRMYQIAHGKDSEDILGLYQRTFESERHKRVIEGMEKLVDGAISKVDGLMDKVKRYLFMQEVNKSMGLAFA